MIDILGPDPLVWFGGRWHPIPPKPEDVHPLCVLEAICRIPRYNNQVEPAWTVGQHTLAMLIWAGECGADNSILQQLLIHDWAEAWTGDWPRAVKRATPAIRAAISELEEQIDGAIRTRMGVGEPGAGIVKLYDHPIVSAECRALGWTGDLAARLNARHGEVPDSAVKVIRNMAEVPWGVVFHLLHGQALELFPGLLS